MTTQYRDDIEFKGPVTFEGEVDLSSATVTSPTGEVPVKRYVSQRIAAADVAASGATQSIALTGEPTGAIPIAAYVECYSSGGVSSTNGNTTGLSVEVGTAGDADGYVKSVSIFGVTGPVANGTRGDMIGCYRGTDALILKLTATGAVPNVAHIAENLDLKVVVIYQSRVSAF
jgi:hypothetical protein